MDTELDAFLKRILLFTDLNDSERALFLPHTAVINYAAGEMIHAEDAPRIGIYLILEGDVELFKRTPFGEEKRLSHFGHHDFFGEGSVLNDTPHTTSARALTDTLGYFIRKSEIEQIFEAHPQVAVKMIKRISKVISRRMSQANTKLMTLSEMYTSGRTRQEHDLLGNRDVPDEAYYGVQTLRALENFNISGVNLSFYPQLIESLAEVKMAAARANHDLGLLSTEHANAIEEACKNIINGRYQRHFVVDMIQGGAGTSTNMNANEVIANRALEILGHERGEYQYLHPNNHVNLSQSTNDAYPTSMQLAIIKSNKKLIATLQSLIHSFRAKSLEFAHVIKMGRTQLQDAVPMTLGQSFEAYAVTLNEEVARLNQNAQLFLEVNMGATAIGTGINSDPDYSPMVVKHLAEITGEDIRLAENLVEATQDTGAYIMYSSAMKRLAIKLSKICNDLRLLSSGPRAGFNEINLPPMQPGSSIMPGKVNPVIPEVVNQIAFKVIGNDLTVSLAAEAGQLELNVMEPIIIQSIFESTEMLKNGMTTLKYRCIDGITANEAVCRKQVENSIGLVTALNPYLGYETSSALASEALAHNRSVYELVLEKQLMSKAELDEVLKPENMIGPRRHKPL